MWKKFYLTHKQEAFKQRDQQSAFCFLNITKEQVTQKSSGLFKSKRERLKE